ncbi:SafA/ExsA family spore coat assembly protein [Virgibacillus sp. DJP39]|uniref:LysM peptidoglycan-binding domain-containing protein n=1 Tax=Virgibacillus sp. DJP39 TaxID=3409790 RepID=UPI003BB5EFDD
MRIHIVKKGDTLWEIANKYDVNFNQLKELNSQLSSPDMIMPGMKIKVPSNAKPVKKESLALNEKEMVKTPYKDISPKPMPVIKEDEKETPIMNQKQPMYQMPIMDQDMYQYTTINLSQMPPQKKEAPFKEKPYQMQQPMNQPMHQPMQQPMNQPMHQPMHQPMPMGVPMCCYPMQPMYHHSPMSMPAKKPISYKSPPKPCGCSGAKPPYPNSTMNMNMHQKPHYNAAMDKYNQNSPHYNDVMNMYDDVPDIPMPKKPQSHHDGKSYPKMGMNNGYGDPYPTPPGFQPFRDDEEEQNNK